MKNALLTPVQRAALALQAGDYAGAERLALKMTRDYPKNGFGWKMLGASLLMTGRTEEALTPVQNAVRLLPGDAEARHDLGIVRYALGRHEEAEASLRQAIELRPEFAEAHGNLGNMLRELGRMKEAEASLRQAIALRPGFALAHNNLGNVLRAQGRQEEACAHYLRAIEWGRDYAEAHANLAIALQDMGRLEEAESHYLRAIEIDPGHAEYYRYVVDLKPCTFDDAIVPQLRRLCEKAEDETNRMHACFALAKVCEDMGEVDEVFKLYEAGNRARKKQLAYAIEQDTALFEKIRAAFETCPEMEPVPLHDAKPILIVGMPRSGTSLVEQILASHSMVYGAGELEALRRLAERHFEGSDAALRIASGYFDELKEISLGRSHVADKMPLNFRWLGFLLLANPGVKIVHVMRDPMATCWSIFRQYFPAEGLGFACDLEDLGRYYSLYRELMAFWHARFPGRIYDLNYERLTENQEDETRKLLEYCGLPWEAGCLEFEKNDRAVKTASFAQVRRKMYRGSSKAWMQFEKHLDPLRNALPQAGKASSTASTSPESSAS